MNSTRNIVLLLFGIAAVVILHLLVDVRTDAAPKTIRSNALLPTAETAVSLEIRRAGERETVLSRVSEDWKISSPYVAQADRARVLRLVDALAFSPARDEMTEAELLRIGRTKSDFGLEPPRIRVTAVAADGARTEVSFGEMTPASDGIYAMSGANDTVYVVPTNVLSAVDRDANGFRRRHFFDCTSDQVVAIDVKGATSHFLRLVREDEAWKVSEPYTSVAAKARVRDFLEGILSLRAKDFVWPVGGSNETAAASAALLAGYGLDPETFVTVTLKCLDGKSLMVSFGRTVGQEDVYAQMSDGAIVVVHLPPAVRAVKAAGVTAFVDTRLFPLESKAVTMLSMEDGGTAYLLSRATDGTWRLDAPVSAAADTEQVGKLLDRLLALRTADADSSGVCVSVGTNATPVSVSRKALLGDMRMEDLRDRDILRIDPSHVKRIVVTDAETGKPSSVVFDAENNAWILEGAQGTSSVDCEAVKRLMDALSPLRAVRIARLKVSAAELGVYGLDKPLRTIAVDQTSENAVRRNIRIGDVTEGGRYATFGSADAVFVISSESVAALLAPIAR